MTSWVKDKRGLDSLFSGGVGARYNYVAQVGFEHLILFLSLSSAQSTDVCHHIQLPPPPSFYVVAAGTEVTTGQGTFWLGCLDPSLLAV